MLIAQGVKYPTGADAAPGPQKDDMPTFERVMGRPPVSPYDPFGLPMALAYLEESSPGSLPWTVSATATKSELEQEETEDKIARGRAMLAEARLKAGLPPLPP